MSQPASLVQQLRELTGAGVMECKRALEDAAGDIEKAKKLIAERGLASVGKRSERETGAGLLKTYVHNNRIGVLLEIRAETDFVVRSDPFQQLAQELVMQIAAVEVESVEDLLKQLYVRDESKTVDILVKEVIAKVGENVRVTRFARFAL